MVQLLTQNTVEFVFLGIVNLPVKNKAAALMIKVSPNQQQICKRISTKVIMRAATLCAVLNDSEKTLHMIQT